MAQNSLLQRMMVANHIVAKQENNMSRLDILHHGVLVIIFPIISFISITMAWYCIKSIFGFESRIMGDVFYWINFGIIILVTNKLFVPMKIKFKYLSIFLVLFLLFMLVTVNYMFLSEESQWLAFVPAAKVSRASGTGGRDVV